MNVVSSHSSLRRLEVLNNGMRVEERMIFQVSKDEFLPLLSLRDLETLKFEYGSLDMDDQTLEEIAKALPNLRVLSLFNSSERPAITPQGLITLLRHCPKLQTLGLSFNAALVTEPLDRLEEGVCNTRVSELTVFHSPVGKSVLVAAFLGDVLPSVTRIHTRAGKRVEEWKEVEVCLKAFAMAKKRWKGDMKDGSGSMQSGLAGSS